MTTFSRFTLHVPRSLRLRLLVEAERRGVSLNNLITTLLQQAVELQASQSPAPPVPAKESLPGSTSDDCGGPTARSAPVTTAEGEYSVD